MQRLGATATVLVALCAVVCCAAAAALAAGVPGEKVALEVSAHDGVTLLRRHTGAASFCHRSRPYALTYSVATRASAAFISLDSDVHGLKAVACDLQASRVLLTFDNAAAAAFFEAQISGATDSDAPAPAEREVFLTGGAAYGCVEPTTAAPTPGSPRTGAVMMRRVVATEPRGPMVELFAVPARYDEVIADGQIALGVDETSDACLATVNSAAAIKERGAEAGAVGGDKKLCLGVNVDSSSCDDAKQPIPIYSNQYITVTCSDCFLAWEADLFFELDISWFHLKKIGAGLKGIEVNGALVFDMQAHASWSTGVDKTIPVVTHADVLDFHVGPIPINVWWEIPVQLTADASFDFSAEAKVGALANWNIGDSYVEWTPETHWVHARPDPHFSWTPQIYGEAQFQADATFSIAPSFVMHIDNILQSTLAAVPQLSMNVHGDTQSKQICAELDYSFALTLETDLHLHIGFIHDDQTFGPKSLVSTGTQKIGSWCVGGQ